MEEKMSKKVKITKAIATKTTNYYNTPFEFEVKATSCDLLLATVTGIVRPALNLRMQPIVVLSSIKRSFNTPISLISGALKEGVRACLSWLPEIVIITDDSWYAQKTTPEAVEYHEIMLSALAEF